MAGRRPERPDDDAAAARPVGSGPLDISRVCTTSCRWRKAIGLTLTSGYRPGAITATGRRPTTASIRRRLLTCQVARGTWPAFFTWLIGQRDVKQAFYDPLGSIFGGVLSSYREGGHSDHVHVATYDKGGWLQPGLTLAANYTGRPEPVGMGGVVNFNFPNYVGSRQDLMSWLQNAAAEFKRRNGRSPI